MGKKKLSRTDILRICLEIEKLASYIDDKLIHIGIDKTLKEVVHNSNLAYNLIKVIQTKIKEIVDNI